MFEKKPESLESALIRWISEMPEPVMHEIMRQRNRKMRAMVAPENNRRSEATMLPIRQLAVVSRHRKMYRARAEAGQNVTRDMLALDKKEAALRAAIAAAKNRA